jgi:hypothetical protein
VRGTTTILRVFKANAPQFVYQKGRLVYRDRASPGFGKERGRADPIPSDVIRGPHPAVAGAGRGDRAGPGNRAFTMPPKCRCAKLGSCRKGSETLWPRAIELSVHLSPL